jgi:hypothetical protein
MARHPGRVIARGTIRDIALFPTIEASDVHDALDVDVVSRKQHQGALATRHDTPVRPIVVHRVGHCDGMADDDAILVVGLSQRASLVSINGLGC